jgi:hypothetical protein
MRRYRGTAGALGKAFYKGGFEPRMNKREAALILQLRYGVVEDGFAPLSILFIDRFANAAIASEISPKIISGRITDSLCSSIIRTEEVVRISQRRSMRPRSFSKKTAIKTFHYCAQ